MPSVKDKRPRFTIPKGAHVSGHSACPDALNRWPCAIQKALGPEP